MYFYDNELSNKVIEKKKFSSSLLELNVIKSVFNFSSFLNFIRICNLFNKLYEKIRFLGWFNLHETLGYNVIHYDNKHFINLTKI